MTSIYSSKPGKECVERRRREEEDGGSGRAFFFLSLLSDLFVKKTSPWSLLHFLLFRFLLSASFLLPTIFLSPQKCRLLPPPPPPLLFRCFLLPETETKKTTTLSSPAPPSCAGRRAPVSSSPLLPPPEAASPARCRRCPAPRRPLLFSLPLLLMLLPPLSSRSRACRLPRGS